MSRGCHATLARARAQIHTATRYKPLHHPDGTESPALRPTLRRYIPKDSSLANERNTNAISHTKETSAMEFEKQVGEKFFFLRERVRGGASFSFHVRVERARLLDTVLWAR